MTNGKKQFVTFYVADMFFGIEVQHVQELIRYQEITPVPLAPAVVEGLMNLRGQIVTAVEMRRKLSLPPRDADASPMNIVVRAGDSVVSLLVDEIGDVVEPPSDSYERPPETLRPEEKEIIDCVCKLDRKLLLVLDIDRVFTVTPPHHLGMRREAA
jgi:purine-binding chemotaxis protein CheW